MDASTKLLPTKPSVTNTTSTSSGHNDPPLEIGPSLQINELIKKMLENREQNPNTPVKVTEGELTQLCKLVQVIFKQQPMLIRLRAPVNVCGDTHGQYSDLLRLFQHCGWPDDKNYLFLGDYVDRGRLSIETIALLFCYKVKYPENFFLLRGNHECAAINKIYGFYDEVKRRFTHRLWKEFCNAFNVMPVAALIENKIFCLHGGLSPDLHKLSMIDAIQRPAEVPDTGLLCDLLWSDPDKLAGWGENNRGVSFTFGPDIAQRFCENNKLEMIFRAHQVVEDGYEFSCNRRVLTIFSAPNYCGEFANAAAVVSIDENLSCQILILRPNRNVKPNQQESSIKRKQTK